MQLKLPRPKLAQGAVSIVYHDGTQWRAFGAWQCSSRGILDCRGPPALAPELADRIELGLALGHLRGTVRDGPRKWDWRFFTL